MRKLLSKGIDPSAHRKATKTAIVESAANSFEAIAREWIERRRVGRRQSGARAIWLIPGHFKYRLHQQRSIHAELSKRQPDQRAPGRLEGSRHSNGS